MINTKTYLRMLKIKLARLIGIEYDTHVFFKCDGIPFCVPMSQMVRMGFHWHNIDNSKLTRV